MLARFGDCKLSVVIHSLIFRFTPSSILILILKVVFHFFWLQGLQWSPTRKLFCCSLQLQCKMQRVRARFGVARLEVESAAQQGPQRHRMISKLHLDVCTDTLRQYLKEMNAEDKASVSMMSNAVKWCEDDALEILQLLGSGRTASRRSQQDYRSFVQFISQNRWNQLLDSSVVSAEKLDNPIFDQEILFTPAAKSKVGCGEEGSL